jgi:hypothetical protein
VKNFEKMIIRVISQEKTIIIIKTQFLSSQIQISSMKNGVPKNWRSVFPGIYLRFSKESMEYYNLDIVSMGMVGTGKADNKGMAGNNNQSQVLGPIVHQ